MGHGHGMCHETHSLAPFFNKLRSTCSSAMCAGSCFLTWLFSARRLKRWKGHCERSSEVTTQGLCKSELLSPSSCGHLQYQRNRNSWICTLEIHTIPQIQYLEPCFSKLCQQRAVEMTTFKSAFQVDFLGPVPIPSHTCAGRYK